MLIFIKTQASELAQYKQGMRCIGHAELLSFIIHLSS